LNTIKHSHKDLRDKANTTLLESLGSVQAALAALPDNVVPLPRNLSEAFALSDPILSMLGKQLADARSQMIQLAQAFGAGDAMAEAMALQITAIETAYAERMGALRRNREERDRQTQTGTAHKSDCQAKMFTPEQYDADRKDRRRGNDSTFWWWALLFTIDTRAPMRSPGLRVA
jgi:hypothetical protein